MTSNTVVHKSATSCRAMGSKKRHPRMFANTVERAETNPSCFNTSRPHEPPLLLLPSLRVLSLVFVRSRDCAADAARRGMISLSCTVQHTTHRLTPLHRAIHHTSFHSATQCNTPHVISLSCTVQHSTQHFTQLHSATRRPGSDTAA